MRSGFLILFALLAASCGKLRQEEWPAHLVEFKGFSADQQQQLTSFATELNSRTQRTVLDTNSNADKGYPIYLELVDPPSTEPQRAGYAIREPERCTIQLSRFLFTPEKEDFRKSVFLHEVGHCGGLEHVSDKADLMYSKTAKWSSYDASHLTIFFNKIIAIVDK